MTETTKTRTGTVHQLKVSLNGARPPIWRRVLVPSGITLAELHAVIQVAMGWYDDHLHEFEIGGVRYGQSDLGEWGPAPRNEATVKLERIAPTGSRFTYTYDFGDSWEHTIDVEKVVDRERDKTYPSCVTGRRACPPEDCGGIWGYAELIEVVGDPTHDEHEEMLDWLGGGFDPDQFDARTVNERLARLA